MPSIKGRIVRYRGRKSQLIDLVRKLTESKGRPVCSVDIRQFLSAQEEVEIGYIQALGQILIKAAIVQPDPIPRLHPVGIHGNKTYYCADAKPEWSSAFERFCATARAEFLLKRGFLHCNQPGLRQSDLEKAAASSLRTIIERTTGYLDPSALRFRLDFWLDQNPPGDASLPHFRRLNRREALDLLRREVAVRAEYVPSMNYNRHLARICPTILRNGHPPVYCAEVLRSYCAVQWPIGNENPDNEAASLLHWILVMVMLAQSHSPS
jgi:hypothetical protein